VIGVFVVIDCEVGGAWLFVVVGLYYMFFYIFNDFDI